MVTDRQTRREAFNGANDQVVREHLLDVIHAAKRQSLHSGSFAWGLTSSRMTWELVDKHLSGS